jgi:hypothetical protein
VRRGAAASLLAALLAVTLAGNALALSWKTNSAFTSGGTGWAYGGGMAASSATVAHAVYERYQLGHWTIMYRRTTNSGSSWGGAVRLSRNGANATGMPVIDAAGTGVNAAWVEGDSLIAGLDAIVVTRRSTDSGATFGGQVQVSPTNESAGPPSIARSGARVVVAWTDQLTGRIYLRRSADGGATWASRQLVATTTNRPYGGSAATLKEGYPAVAISGAVVHVAYFAASRTLRLRSSTDGAATLKAPVTLATNASSGFAPSVAASGSTVVAGYAASTSSDVWTVVRRSTDKGVHWSSVISLNPASSTRSWSPVVSVRGTRWMAAYERCTSSTCAASATYYRASTNGGSTWSSPIAASVHHRAWALPADVEVATRTLVMYVDYDNNGNDVYLRAGQ